MTILSTENQLTPNSTLAYDVSDHACILLKGPDAKSFLHRLSTNDVEKQATLQSCFNVLVNQKGRMVELLHQVIIDDEQILIIGSRDRGDELCAWLDQFLFTEQVTIENITNTRTLTLLIGASADEHQHDFIMRSFDFVGSKSQAIPSFLVCDLTKNIQPAATFIHPDEFETARIAAKIPSYPTEINATFNPLELGLNQAIHWAKGCYIGQEVISRLDTYGKLSKRLTGILCSAEDFPRLKPGQSIICDGQNIGHLTSVSPRYWQDHIVALAMIKIKPDLELAGPVSVAADPLFSIQLSN